MTTPPRKLWFFYRATFLPAVVLACVSILAYLLLIQPWSLRQTSLPLKVGDVAPQDMRAPHDVQYVSTVKTEEARAAAERSVEPIYAPPDPSVARGQIEKLNSILSAITAIRMDTGSSPNQKKTDLITLQGITLQGKSVEILLLISDPRWEAVQAEALSVLEKVMQNSIRSDDLETVRQNVPSLVSYTLTENEAGLVVDLVSPLIAANSFYSPELTETARQAARDAVQPVTQSYVKDQTIVSRGQVISAADYEALMTFGLVHAEAGTLNYLGAAALVVISAIFTGMYFHRRRQAFASDLRGLILLAMLFLIFLAGARIAIPNRTVLPYLFPVAAFGLLVSVLFGMERGMLFSLLMSAMAAYGMSDSFGLMPYYIMGSLCGILALGQARRVGQFLYAGVAIAGAGVAMVAAYRLPFTETDWIGIATLAGAALLNGIASTGIALPLQYLLAQFLGLTTAMQLLEISRPDAPLLSSFLQRAPGTYQHSLQVANLAEQAAERIGADALLTRVGALFHDIGKAENPLFFVENQPPSQIDAHDDLSPEASARTIIQHIPDGLEAARKHRLPRRIIDFIAEHHGTLITRYQYNRAVQAAGGDASRVDEAQFRYPGPTPRSKETAVLMLADGVEARARAERPQDEDQLRAIVHSVIEVCRKDGQLEEAPLSQQDLSTITESFINTLRVTFHPRLTYPQEQPVPPAPPEQDLPTLPVPPRAKKGK